VEAFKALEKKYSKKIASVTPLNSRLLEDHMLPMIIVQDRNSGDIVTQILSFSDLFPTKQQVTPESKDFN
jgi:hypothetical protein